MRVENTNDAIALIRAFRAGRIRGFGRAALLPKHRESLVVHGNVVITFNRSYTDGHKWGKFSPLSSPFVVPSLIRVPGHRRKLQDHDEYLLVDQDDQLHFHKYCMTFTTSNGAARLISYWSDAHTHYPHADKMTELKILKQCLSSNS